VREGKKQHTKTQPRIAQLNLISRAGAALTQQKRDEKKRDIFGNHSCVVIITRCCPHSIRTRASLQKEEKR
jgi:hypothetical protein